MKLRSRVAIFLLAMLVIGGAWLMIGGKAWFVPNTPRKDSLIQPNYPDKVAGITPQEKMKNLLEQWNEIGEAEGYKVSGEYKLEQAMTGKIMAVNLMIALLFDYPNPEEYFGKASAVTGKIIIPTAKIFKPLHKITLTIIYMPNESPAPWISVVNLGSAQIESVKGMDIESWTKEIFVNEGEVCADENGKITICLPTGEPLFLP